MLSGIAQINLLLSYYGLHVTHLLTFFHAHICHHVFIKRYLLLFFFSRATYCLICMDTPTQFCHYFKRRRSLPREDPILKAKFCLYNQRLTLLISQNTLLTYTITLARLNYSLDTSNFDISKHPPALHVNTCKAELQATLDISNSTLKVHSSINNTIWTFFLLPFTFKLQLSQNINISK